MDTYEIYFTAGVRLRSQRSVFVPVMSNKNIRTINSSLNSQRCPLPPTDDSETDGSSQDEESVLTPLTEEDMPLESEEGGRCPHSIPPMNRGIAKSDEEMSPSRGPQAICSHTHGSVQYFRLAHEYAQAARAAAQVELDRIISEHDANSYPTMHTSYDHWTAAALDGPYYYVYDQVYNDLSGIPEGEIGYELGWTPSAWNAYYGEPGEVEWFHPTE